MIEYNIVVCIYIYIYYSTIHKVIDHDIIQCSIPEAELSDCKPVLRPKNHGTQPQDHGDALRESPG